jgi:hypothetical protein
MSFEYSIGNMKIGNDTLIFNMGSATDCPSGKIGLCTLFQTNDCYALKSEKMYPQVLPFRTRQESYWLENDAFTIAGEIAKAFARKLKTPLKYVRVNEAGDMHSSECLEKLIQIANILPDIIFYTYTHRSDIVTNDITLPDNLIINCSNFTRKGCNSFSVEFNVKVNSLKKEFVIARHAIKKIHGANALSCIGDCSKCTLCKINHGKTIWVPLH